MDSAGAALDALLGPLRGLARALLPRPAAEALGPASAAASLEAMVEAVGAAGGDVARVLLAGAALALGALALALLATRLLAARVRPDHKAAFFAIFEDRIRGGFPGQLPATMATVLTGVNSVLRPAPESPCVLLLVSAPGAEATALRLAKAVAEAVQAVLRKGAAVDELELQGEAFAAHTDYWLLFESLSHRLEERGVALVRGLEAVHPRAAAAIAHLCDDALPLFPQSVVLLLLSPGERFPAGGSDATAAGAVVVAERCLVDCWLARAPSPSSGALPPAWASRETLPATLARLTGRSVLVLPEAPDCDPRPASAKAEAAEAARAAGQLAATH